MEQFNRTINSLLDTPMPQPGTTAILISLAAALAFAGVIWLVYRFSNTQATYQPRFAATLVSLTLLSTVLMDLIQCNLALSLGMLGSLSIVRFRTNIRDPRDIGYIFWAMAAGLASSTGCYLIGLAGSAILAVFLLSTRRTGSAPGDMMLVIRGSQTASDRKRAIRRGKTGRRRRTATRRRTDKRARSGTDLSRSPPRGTGEGTRGKKKFERPPGRGHPRFRRFLCPYN